MPRQIIILVSPPTGNPDLLNVQGVFWLRIPVRNSRWYADPNRTSLVPDATTDELTMIKRGTIKEQEFAQHYQRDITPLDMTNDLNKQFDQAQTLVTNDPSYQWAGVYKDENDLWWYPTSPPTPVELPVINPLSPSDAPQSPSQPFDPATGVLMPPSS